MINYEGMRYVSFSGGADSTALAIYLKEEGEDFELVFADTGAELPETYWIVPRVARALSKKLHVICGGTFFQHVATYGYMLPDSIRRWCTKDLKQIPLRKFFEKRWCIVSVGITADESHRLEPSPTRRIGYEYDRPLIEAGIDKAAARRLCERYDLLNPCYSWRSSCSCFCCPFQRKSDWRNLAKEHPELFALAEAWEDFSVEKSGHTWVKGYSLKQLREADEAQVKLFEECREQACAICSW